DDGEPGPRDDITDNDFPDPRIQPRYCHAHGHRCKRQHGDYDSELSLRQALLMPLLTNHTRKTGTLELRGETAMTKSEMTERTDERKHEMSGRAARRKLFARLGFLSLLMFLALGNQECPGHGRSASIVCKDVEMRI